MRSGSRSPKSMAYLDGLAERNVFPTDKALADLSGEDITRSVDSFAAALADVHASPGR